MGEKNVTLPETWELVVATITRIVPHGAYVTLDEYNNAEGLLHISELADHKIDKPQDIVDVGQEVEVKILKVDSESRKIGLSLRRVQWAADEQGEEKAEKEPVRRKHPTAVENVLSDHDVARITGAKEEAESGDATGSDAVEDAVKADSEAQSMAQEQTTEPAEENKEEVADDASEKDQDEASADDAAEKKGKVEVEVAEAGEEDAQATETEAAETEDSVENSKNQEQEDKG